MCLNPEENGFNSENSEPAALSGEENAAAQSNAETTADTPKEQKSDQPKSNEAFSVFSDPAHFGDNPEKERKKKSSHPMRNKIIAGLACTAIIAGAAFAAVKLIPKQQENNEDSSISLLNVSSSDITGVKINNSLGEIVLKSEISESDSSSEVVWSVEGVNPEYTSSETIKSTVSSLASTSALEKMAADAEGDYGFDKSELTAEFTFSSGSKTLVFGDTAPADIGVYCKISGEDGTVYIVSLNTVLSFQCSATDFADTAGFSGVEITSANNSCFNSDGSIISFDYIKLGGKKFAQPLKIEMQNDDSINEYFAFKITSPITRIGDNDNTQILVDTFAKGIQCAGVYSYESTAENLKKYNLAEPDLIVTMSIGGTEHTLKFGTVDENYCSMLTDGSPVIYKVAISSVGFYSLSLTDYYSTFMVLENLSGLNKLSVSVAGEATYEFDLEYTADEDGSNPVYKAFYGGKELDITSFKNYYQTIIGMSPIAYDTGSTAKTSMEIRFSHSSGISDTVLSFRQYSSQRYQVDIDGIPLGLITKTTYDTFIENTKKIANGETM